MASNYLASGYTKKMQPVTQIEAVNRQSSTHVKTVAKNAVLKHIRSFLDTDGEHRKLTKELFPDVLKFSTEGFEVTSATEAANKVHMPVYKFLGDIQGHLPCIVVNDTGITFKTAGLGFNQGNIRGPDHVIYSVITVLRSVQLSLLVATTDQSTTDTVAGAVALIFGELSGITTGMSLSGKEPGEHWLIRLPKIPEVGNSERAQLGDDQKDLLWTSLTQLQVEYEDSFLIPFEEPKWSIHDAGRDGFPTRSMEFPGNVVVGRQSRGQVMNISPGEVVTSSDPSVLRLRVGSLPGEYYLIGVRPGTAYVRVTSGIRVEGGPHANLLDEHAVVVSY